MRRLIATFALLLLGSGAIAAPEVAADRLLQHVKFLSSDELKGRGNGSPELQRAAAYVGWWLRRARWERVRARGLPRQRVSAWVEVERWHGWGAAARTE